MRLARRIRRDTVQRGRDIDSVLEQASLLFLLSFEELTVTMFRDVTFDKEFSFTWISDVLEGNGTMP